MNTTPFWKRPWVIGLAVLILIAIWLVSAYNGFVAKSAAVEAQWAQVETQYQRRFDLIPNLVSSVQGIMEQEQDVFKSLADARTRYSGAGTVDEKAQAATQVDSALARLLVVVENYPQLRSSESVQQLMDQLEGTENRISVERNRFNENVQAYNVAVTRFPGNISSRIFGFAPHAYYRAAEGADVVPQVEL